MTSRFPKLTLKFVTDSNRLVMAILPADAFHPARAGTPARTVSIIQNTAADEREVIFLSRDRGVGLTPLRLFARGQHGANRPAYNVRRRGAGKRSEDLRCMALHTLLLLLQAGPDVRYNPLPPA